MPRFRVNLKAEVPRSLQEKPSNLPGLKNLAEYASFEVMDARQLPLFSTPKPLLERFGMEFFKRVPARPGVYLMGGQGDGLLYVGKAQNLRERLNSYKNAQPGRVSRKLLRLLHQVRSITWEICSSPTAALLRENELLRLHKPKFNVLNTRPEHYRFFGLRLDGATLHLRLTKETVGEPDEQWFGAFKGLGRVRGTHAALLRLLWCVEHEPASLYDLPAELSGARRLPPRFTLRLGRLEPAAAAGWIAGFLAGESEAALAVFESRLLEQKEPLPCLRCLHAQDVTRLREFFRIGPARNFSLRHQCGLDSIVIQPAELDDLLAMVPKPEKPGSDCAPPVPVDFRTS
jgi:predicted GIY-YIG superfamily endonuclease